MLYPLSYGGQGARGRAGPSVLGSRRGVLGSRAGGAARTVG